MLCLLTASTAAQSDEPGLDWLLHIPSPPSRLSLEVGTGEDDNRELRLDSDLAFVDDSRLLLSYGRSRQPLGRDWRIDSESYRLGLASDPLRPLTLELALDRWGQRPYLAIEGAQFAIRYHWRHWLLGLHTQLRTIELQLRNRQIDFASRTLGGELHYTSPRGWLAGGHYLHHRYSRDLGLLTTTRAIRALSPITLNLSYSLESERLGGYLGYAFSRLELRLERTRIRAAIDGLPSDYLEFGATLYFFQQWELLLRLGRQDQPDAPPLRYASLGLGLSW